jgi:hypothetical protein
MVVLGMIGCAFHPAGTMAEDRLRVTVTVYNRSNMRGPMLEAGEGVAKEVLRGAGLESVWVNCPVSSTMAADGECMLPPNRTRLVLTVVPRWPDRRVDPRSLGLALEVEHGFGAYCYVFQERLEELAAAAHNSAADLLGRAMAHEVGHLLKGPGSHSPRGIMSEQWQADELRAAAMGRLNFMEGDAVRMRRRLGGVESMK